MFIARNIRSRALSILPVSVAVFSTLFILAACSKPAPVAQGPQPVFVSTVHLEHARFSRSYTGSIRARYETDFGFRTPGKVVERLVDIGDLVKEGQPLARLDVADYKLSVAAARDSLRAGEVEAVQAASDEARFQRLLADGSLGTADHERQKAKADAASARFERAKSELALAQNKLDYTTLTAPYAGVITGLRMEAGQVVAEGQAVISIAKPSEMEVVADLPEQVVNEARTAEASGQLWERSDVKLHLKLRELSPAAFNQSRTFRARFSIVDADKATLDALHLGMTTELMLGKADSVASAVLPAGAVVKSSGTPSVWVVDANGALKQTPVQVVAFMQEAVSVTGLAEGMRVVSAGAQKLDASMRVAPTERTVSGVNLEGPPPPTAGGVVVAKVKE